MSARRLLPFALAACLSGGVSAALAQEFDFSRVFSLVGNIADAVREIPVEEELTIGAGMSAQLLGTARLVRDDELQRYVNQVGRWIAQHTERPELPWRFGVLDTSTINAYAAPGGFVFITRGMFRLLDSESALAGVLAHEIGHVLRRHHLAAIRSQAQAGIAGDALSLLAGSEGVNLDSVIDAGVNLYSRGLDRGDELEADRIGVVLAARAGYEPYGLTRMLQALGGLKPGSNDFQQMFSTHPRSEERLAALAGLMPATLAAHAGAPSVEDRFRRMKARLR